MLSETWPAGSGFPDRLPYFHFMTNKLELVREKQLKNWTAHNTQRHREKKGGKWLDVWMSCHPHVIYPSIQHNNYADVVVAIMLGDYRTARTKIKTFQMDGKKCQRISLQIPKHMASGRVRIRYEAAENSISTEQYQNFQWKTSIKAGRA